MTHGCRRLFRTHSTALQTKRIRISTSAPGTLKGEFRAFGANPDIRPGFFRTKPKRRVQTVSRDFFSTRIPWFRVPNPLRTTGRVAACQPHCTARCLAKGLRSLGFELRNWGSGFMIPEPGARPSQSVQQGPTASG